MALPMKAVFAALATGILVWGILDCITNFEENGCEMTWMFEYPKYLVRLTLSHVINYFQIIPKTYKVTKSKDDLS